MQCGKVSNLWKACQNEYMIYSHVPESIEIDNWMCLMIKAFMLHAIEVWKERNVIYHNKTEGEIGTKKSYIF